MSITLGECYEPGHIGVTTTLHEQGGTPNRDSLCLQLITDMLMLRNHRYYSSVDINIRSIIISIKHYGYCSRADTNI